jgi:hypothetical protein
MGAAEESRAEDQCPQVLHEVAEQEPQLPLPLPAARPAIS